MSIRDWLSQASIMIVGFAVIGVYLGLTVIMVVGFPDHALTDRLLDTLVTLALPAAIAAILTRDKGPSAP